MQRILVVAVMALIGVSALVVFALLKIAERRKWATG